MLELLGTELRTVQTVSSQCELEKPCSGLP